MREFLHRRFKSYTGQIPPAPGTYRMVVDHHTPDMVPVVGEKFNEYLERSKDARTLVKETEHDWEVEA